MLGMAGTRALGAGATGMPASIGGSVPPLPKPPAVEVVAFESPLFAAIALVVAGLAVAWALRGGSRAKLGRLAAGGLAIVAGGLMVTAAMVETPREKMSRRTRELVRAAVTADVGTMREILAVDARVRAGERFRWVGRIEANGRDEIISRVEREIGKELRIENWAVLKLEAKRDGPNVGRTQTQVRVDIGGPVFSWWRLDWRQDEDGEWRVIGIEPLFLGGVGG